MSDPSIEVNGGRVILRVPLAKWSLCWKLVSRSQTLYLAVG